MSLVLVTLRSAFLLRNRSNFASCIKTFVEDWRPGWSVRTGQGEVCFEVRVARRALSSPMGTMAKVTNLENDKKVEVRINDRGPYEGDRVIDLSRAAASRLDMVDDVISRVRIEAQAQPRTDSGNASR